MLEEPARAAPSEPAVLLATWFGSGYLPIAPGSCASLTALPCAALLAWLGGPALVLLACVGGFLVGMWASGAYMTAVGVHDPPAIVIDEVVGQWLVLALAPLDPVVYAFGFLLFRVIDVLKPWPANVVDRAVTGGFGVMLDDVVAAVYAGGVLWLIVPWLP